MNLPPGARDEKRMGCDHASNPKENNMIRKFAIAAAIAALGSTSVALNSPAAAAKGPGGFHHGHFRGLGIGLGFDVVDSCYREVWTVNRRGEPVLRTIYVCD
jgi:hypothetical protein